MRFREHPIASSIGVIAVSGIWLDRYANVIAEKSPAWRHVGRRDPRRNRYPVSGTGGRHLLDYTGKSAVHRPGDGLGSCIFNLLLIAILGFSCLETPIFLKAKPGTTSCRQVSRSCSSASSHSACYLVIRRTCGSTMGTIHTNDHRPLHRCGSRDLSS
jgi:hypothetical protein